MLGAFVVSEKSFHRFLLVHDRSLDFQTAVRPIFRYNFRGGILFAVVLCSVFDAEIQQIDILIIRRILSNECYLTAILYMGRMFRKYQRYMPVNIWSIGVLLMLLLFLQYKNVTVAIASHFPAAPCFLFCIGRRLSVYLYFGCIHT